MCIRDRLKGSSTKYVPLLIVTHRASKNSMWGIAKEFYSIIDEAVLLIIRLIIVKINFMSLMSIISFVNYKG